MTTSADYRLEHDFLGPREIPARALYGAHTSRSLENFPISGTPLPIEIIHGMVLLKLAAARANAKLGLLPSAKAAAIEKACRDILTGAHDTELPVDI